MEDEDETFTELFKMYDAVKESEAPMEPKLVSYKSFMFILMNYS